MNIIKYFRRRRRQKLRRKLSSFAYSGAKIAHLPAFLDRAPRHDYHRALKHAFMRGFIWEQRFMEVAWLATRVP